jgi:uncharacterized protein
MSEKTELVAGFYRALAERDLDTALAMIDPSIRVRQTDELPWGGEYEGLDGYADFFGKLLGAITSKVEVEEIFEAGDHVVEIGRTRGTVNATGAAFDVREVHVWELRDGKAVSFHAYIDTPTMLATLRAGN